VFDLLRSYDAVAEIKIYHEFFISRLIGLALLGCKGIIVQNNSYSMYLKYLLSTDIVNYISQILNCPAAGWMLGWSKPFQII